MTDTPGAAASAEAHRPDPHDPHDHTGHDHPPSGADLVRGLVQGLSVLALIIPVLAVVLLLAILPFAPTSPATLLLGVGLGALQLLVLVLASLGVARSRTRLTLSPVLPVVRGVADEVLRVGAVLVAVLLWPADQRIELGVWVGAGTALVWLALATAQTVSTRRRISRRSDWSQDMVSRLLADRIDARGAVRMRLLDVVGTAAFQIGATVLVVLSPVLAAGTAVLAIAAGLSTLVLQRRPPGERSRTPWAYAPLGIGLLTLALAVFGALSL